MTRSVHEELAQWLVVQFGIGAVPLASDPWYQRGDIMTIVAAVPQEHVELPGTEWHGVAYDARSRTWCDVQVTAHNGGLLAFASADTECAVFYSEHQSRVGLDLPLAGVAAIWINTESVNPFRAALALLDKLISLRESQLDRGVLVRGQRTAQWLLNVNLVAQRLHFRELAAARARRLAIFFQRFSAKEAELILGADTLRTLLGERKLRLTEDENVVAHRDFEWPAVSLEEVAMMLGESPGMARIILREAGVRSTKGILFNAEDVERLTWQRRLQPLCKENGIYWSRLASFLDISPHQVHLLLRAGWLIQLKDARGNDICPERIARGMLALLQSPESRFHDGLFHPPRTVRLHDAAEFLCCQVARLEALCGMGKIPRDGHGVSSYALVYLRRHPYWLDDLGQ